MSASLLQQCFELIAAYEEKDQLENWNNRSERRAVEQQYAYAREEHGVASPECCELASKLISLFEAQHDANRRREEMPTIIARLREGIEIAKGMRQPDAGQSPARGRL